MGQLKQMENNVEQEGFSKLLIYQFIDGFSIMGKAPIQGQSYWEFGKL
jgi:hypothetical protein